MYEWGKGLFRPQFSNAWRWGLQAQAVLFVHRYWRNHGWYFFLCLLICLNYVGDLAQSAIFVNGVRADHVFFFYVSQASVLEMDIGRIKKFGSYYQHVWTIIVHIFSVKNSTPKAEHKGREKNFKWSTVKMNHLLLTFH